MNDININAALDFTLEHDDILIYVMFNNKNNIASKTLKFTVAKKYDIADTTKYYLSYNDGDNAKVKDVTLNISEIYKELSDPLQRLENEGYKEEM